MKQWKWALAVGVPALTILGWQLIGQQSRDAEQARLEAYRAEPGGTPEEKLWQVIVLMGAGDTQPARWNGTVSISGGEIYELDGYRFEPPDRLLPEGGWEMETRVERVLLGSGLAGPGAAKPELRLLPKGLLLRGAGGPSTRLSVRTQQGAVDVAPMALRFGEPEKSLGGRIEVLRIPPATDLSGTELRQHDFPAIATGSGGDLSVVWSSYHDRDEELNFRRRMNGAWTRLIPVGRARADLWRPQIAVDEGGKTWLVWSQQVNGNWDIYSMAWEDNEWGPMERLTTDPLPDIEPHVARGGDGTVFLVWQAMAGRSSQIRLKHLRRGTWSQTVAVTTGPMNDWEPSVAAGADGRAWVVWDRYASSYDVVARSYSPESGLGPEMNVAATGRFEAHATVTVDGRNRPWVAWEAGAANWGKDLGAALGTKAPGSPLGGARSIEVVCLDQGAWKSAPAFGRDDALAAGATEESVPLLHADPDGNIWVAFKRRYSRAGFRTSLYWESFLTRLNGDYWETPMPLPNSWTRKSVRLGLASSEGRLWAFWPSESRKFEFASRPRLNRVIAGSVPLPGPGRDPRLGLHQPPDVSAAAADPNEAEAVRRIRGHRVRLGGQALRIVRGDLHRHTELSPDNGGLDDGSLPEFYRYMIDAAEMDFGASTDHQAGGTDYWNFLTQKMTDMYHFPQRYVPFYAYERNLGNPHGHRNIIHMRRNYPIVPFFMRIDSKFMLPDTPDGEMLTFNSNAFGGGINNDTKLLYEEIRKTGGIAISHTTATNSMGTDWADNDPKLEPVVEIYQGARQSYEHKNAPRGVKDGEERQALGGYQEPGLVWNAWKKGYRLGVIASSDHFSTHISYALVYTPAQTRNAIFEAIKRRQTYGATDNIILEFWIGDRFMGDDFTAAEKQKIRVKAIGTGRIETIHLLRDGQYIYKVSPGKTLAEFEYVDQEAGKGSHWYYVRVEQADGNLAWSSPIWVKY